MDAAAQPPWVRALCLRSTASQAPERTAASGWAGPRSGVYGVSRNLTHPAIPQEPRFCFGCCCCSSSQQVQGCKPCRPTPSLRTTDVTLMRHARGCPPAVRVEVATVHWQSAQAYAWPLGLAVVVGGIGAWLILWIYHRLKGRDRRRARIGRVLGLPLRPSPAARSS